MSKYIIFYNPLSKKLSNLNLNKVTDIKYNKIYFKEGGIVKSYHIKMGDIISYISKNTHRYNSSISNVVGRYNKLNARKTLKKKLDYVSLLCDLDLIYLTNIR